MSVLTPARAAAMLCTSARAVGGEDIMAQKRRAAALEEFSAAEIGGLAHLYRGEVYRSTVWRTRLDTTTNWSVVTLGVALSITFSSPDASPLPLVLVGVLILFFLALEARRYRFFNVWRARTRWMEKHFYTPMLTDGDFRTEDGWHTALAEDYRDPQYHVGFVTALARRVRANYLWILLIQTLAYVGKLIVHPVPVENLTEFLRRADIGPIPGALMMVLGVVYIVTWTGLAIWVARADSRRIRERGGFTPLG
jgi:uncharacterized membrane protein